MAIPRPNREAPKNVMHPASIAKLAASQSYTETMNSLEQLLEFLGELQNSRIQFRLECVRDAIMVVIPTPRRYHEIEFFADGYIENMTLGPRRAVTRIKFDEICNVVIRDVNG